MFRASLCSAGAPPKKKEKETREAKRGEERGARTLNPKRHFNGSPPLPKLWTTIFSLRRTIWILTQSCLLPRVRTPISCFYTESPSARGSYSAQLSSQCCKSTGRAFCPVSQQTLGRLHPGVHSPPMMQPFWPWRSWDANRGMKGGG